VNHLLQSMVARGTGLLCCLLIASLTTSKSWAMSDNRPDAALALLGAFRGTCGSQGAFTQSASLQTQAIVNVIETLKNTDACKPYISQLSTIQTATAQIQALQSTPSYSAYQADQQNYQLLTLALASSPAGSAQATGLQSALDTLRLQMFTDQASYNVATQTSQHNLRINQTENMLSWGQQLASTSASSGLLQCLQQSPLAALELGSNMAAYGGSFLPGIFGAAIGAIGQLFNTGFELFRQGQYDSATSEAQSSQMPDALECALESMTDSYCSAQDSAALLDLARRNRIADYSATPLWKGIDILSRQLPALLQWLGQIQNEVPPQDAYQASKQNSVFQEIFEVQEQNLNSIATINNAIDQAQSSSTDAAKSSVLINAIAGLALQLVSPATVASGPNSISFVPTPFSIFQPNAAQWACWLVIGPTANCPAVPPQDQNPNGNPQLSQLSDYLGTTLGLNSSAQLILVEGSLLSNWNKLVPLVQVLVNADFARIIATNAGIILASARVPANGNPLSPFQVLLNISDFLSGISAGGTDNPQLTLAVKQEKQKVDETLRQLTASDQEVCPPQTPLVRPGLPGGVHVADPAPMALTAEQCQVQRLVTIFNLFELQNGTQVFLTDMNGFINIDLQNRFAAGAVDPNPTKLLQASGQDLAVALQAAGIGDLDPLADDLANARADIEENIQVFRNFFVKGFVAAVKREGVYARAENPSDGTNRPHGQRLAELCLLWLETGNSPLSGDDTTDTWPDSDTQSVCESTTYFNGNLNPSAATPEPPAFQIGKTAAQLSGLPFQKRVCTFHSYKIANKANTRFGIPPGPSPFH